MHLRSGIFYRSGNPIARENVRRISTEESTARTPGLEVVLPMERKARIRAKKGSCAEVH